VVSLVAAVRPRQWPKNLLLFGGLFFTQGFKDIDLTLRALAGFGIFCALAGAVYLLNDVRDKDQDAVHPEKRLRPVAAGELSTGAALAAAAVLALIAGVASVALGRTFAFVGLAYLVLQAAYSYGLKNIVILDVFLLATGFVLRALAGAVVINVTFSPWLFLCTMMLALFLGFGKRRHELVTLVDFGSHRPALLQYTPALLDQAVGLSATASVLSYALYTIESSTGKGHRLLMCTIPFVMYGVLRYLYHLYANREGGSPERILFTDIHIAVTLLLWVIGCVLAMILGGGSRP
jgi:4-hydroxybenzoate polyprenyltransferase